MVDVLYPIYVKPCGGEFEIRLKVVPGASRSEIVGVHGDRLKIRIAEPPERGKANRAVIKLIEGWLGIKGAELVSGESSPEKCVRVKYHGSWPELVDE